MLGQIKNCFVKILKEESLIQFLLLRLLEAEKDPINIGKMLLISSLLASESRTVWYSQAVGSAMEESLIIRNSKNTCEKENKGKNPVSARTISCLIMVRLWLGRIQVFFMFG